MVLERVQIGMGGKKSQIRENWKLYLQIMSYVNFRTSWIKQVFIRWNAAHVT